MDLKLNAPCKQLAKRWKVIDGKMIAVENPIDVTLMAISGKYAMVRRKGAMPYVCTLKELKP